MKMKICDLFFDKNIYPRRQKSHKTIESYIESLKIGAVFPPILVQKVKYSEDVKMVILDGVHRLEAYRHIYGEDAEIECELYKNEVLNIESCLEELRLESAFRNVMHGDRLSQEDRKFQARRIVNQNPKISNKILAQKFGVTEWTVTQWVKDIRARYYASRDALVYKLYLLGWRQTEISSILNISQQFVSQITSNFRNLKTLVFSDFHEKHKSIEEICQYYQIDEPLAWAIILEGKSDLERFELFGDSKYGDDSPRIYNYWYFPERDKRLGISDYAGNLSAQVTLNLIYYFSELWLIHVQGAGQL